VNTDPISAADVSSVTLEECFRRAEEEHAKGEAADLEAARASDLWYLAAKKKAKKEGRKWLPEIRARCEAKSIAQRTAYDNMRVAEKWDEVVEFAARCTFPEPKPKRAFIDLRGKMKDENPGGEEEAEAEDSREGPAGPADDQDQERPAEPEPAKDDEQYDYAAALRENWQVAQEEERAAFVLDYLDEVEAGAISAAGRKKLEALETELKAFGQRRSPAK
jgi:hypothetical protein